MLAEEVETASPQVVLVLVEANGHPFGGKCSDIKFEADFFAQPVGAIAGARGVWVRDSARGGVVRLSECGGGNEGERRLGFDAGAEVDKPVKQFACKFDSEVNTIGLVSKFRTAWSSEVVFWKFSDLM